MKHRPWRGTALLTLPLAALLLTGCGVSAGSATDASSGAGSAPNASTAADDSTKPDDGTAAFGKTYTYDDGLQVTVTSKGTFKPSEYAATTKAKKYASYLVTVKNGSKEAFDPTLFRTTLQDGEAEADSVIDSAKGYELSPQTKLLPGRTVKWKVGYGVNTSDLVMEVTPDFEHDSVIFKSE